MWFLDQIDYVRYEREFEISSGGRSCHIIPILNDMETEPTIKFLVLINSSNSATGPHATTVYIYDDDGEYSHFIRETFILPHYPKINDHFETINFLIIFMTVSWLRLTEPSFSGTPQYCVVPVQPDISHCQAKNALHICSDIAIYCPPKSHHWKKESIWSDVKHTVSLHSD